MIARSSSDPIANFIPLLEKAGYRFVSPALLQPAAPFLDLSGEELRKSMYLTQDQQGHELCLRPDLTIPAALHYLNAGSSSKEERFSYLGLVFRAQTEECHERLQGGFESFGHPNRAAEDAETLAKALDALSLWGEKQPAIRMGDLGFIDSLLEALELTPAWRRRIRRAAAQERGLDAALAALAKPDKNNATERAAFLAALGGTETEAAKSVVEDLLSIAGISQVGGRSAGDIAERLLEQAQLNMGAKLPEKAHAILSRYFSIASPLPEAFTSLQKLAQDMDVDLSAALEQFAERLRAFKSKNIDPRTIMFAARFGRRLDYYTGFVFELHNETTVLAGGGRYDTLLSTLGAPEPIPAVGCAIWVDRLQGKV